MPLADPNHPEAGNGSDLDNGWTGTSHNFPIIGGTTLKYCLSDCDRTSATTCTATGTTGAGSLNGPTFGAPLPLLAAGIPVCVVNRYQPGDLKGTFDLQTGEAGTTTPNLVPLFSDIYLRLGKSAAVCPRCMVAGGGGGIGSVGKCDAESSTPGASCTVDGVATVQQGPPGTQSYTLSSSCTPAGGAAATLDIPLNLTTGTATKSGSKPCPDGTTGAPQTQDDSCGAGTCTPGACTGTACVSGSGENCVDIKGGISQACCSNSTSTPCFATKGGGEIRRTGTPTTDGGTAVFATTFCIDATGSPAIDTTTGLPGPGALVLPAQVDVLPKVQ